MRSLSRKGERVIKEMVEGGRLFESPLSVMAREGARMMLRVALAIPSSSYQPPSLRVFARTPLSPASPRGVQNPGQSASYFVYLNHALIFAFEP